MERDLLRLLNFVKGDLQPTTHLPCHQRTLAPPLLPGSGGQERLWADSVKISLHSSEVEAGGEHLQWRAQWKKRCYIHINYFGNVYERNQPNDRQEI